MSLFMASGSLEEDYSSLREAGREAVESGDLALALEVFELAWNRARELGDQALIDQAFCNLSLVRIELGCAEGASTGLREILLRNGSDENCRLAAYHLARVFELDKSSKKALFYARIALDRSRKLDRSDWMASSYNLVGDLLLAESFTDQAIEQYEEALGLLGDQVSVRRGQILDNLGYCRVLQRRYREGIQLLDQSRLLLEGFGAGRYLTSTHLDLCFAYLEIEQSEVSIPHGKLALELAREHGLVDSEKNSLYLLGQAEWLAGHVETAKSYYAELEHHYPGTAGLTDLLVTFDIRQLINLRA